MLLEGPQHAQGQINGTVQLGTPSTTQQRKCYLGMLGGEFVHLDGLYAIHPEWFFNDRGLEAARLQDRDLTLQHKRTF